MNRTSAMTVAGALLVALVLGVFAYVIADSQSKDRDDVEQRFTDVADVSASVTDGIFQASLNATRRQAATEFAGESVTSAQVEELATTSRLRYAVILDGRGRTLAATEGAPRSLSDAVDVALETGKARLSDVIGSGKQATIEWAIPYPAGRAQRVLVEGIPMSAFAEFLATSLAHLPNFADAETLMVDGNGVVIGGVDVAGAVGAMLEDTALLEALGAREHGSYGDERFFASGPISGSPFKIVLDTSKSRLYDSIGGSRKTIPWILFAAFGLAALAGLYLLRRATFARSELERRRLNERHAVEINDNIIQGLALAKYQLQAGEGEASAAQVTETLREAQRLVSDLLGDAEVRAGQLRRKAAAETSRDPDAEPER